MKRLLIGMLAVGSLALQMSAAEARPVCAAGVYHAGCAGYRGAVVVRHPVYHPVYHRHCVWRAG